jgi:hypothetical protein
MLMAEGKFVTAINCMDGRTQQPVSVWMREKFGADYVDTITEPGADKALTDSPQWQVDSIKARTLISVNGHGSDIIAIVSHHDCAGNPVSKEQHLEMTRKAVEVVASWNLPVRILGLWVGEDWSVEVICEK